MLDRVETCISWFFQGNIPRRLISALNDNSSLHSIHLWLYNRSKNKLNIANISSSTTKSLSLVFDDERPSKRKLDSGWLPSKDGPDLFLDTDAILEFCDKHRPVLAPIDPVSVRIPKRRDLGVASLVLYQTDIRLWQKVASSHTLDLCNLKRLALIRCDNPMLMPWSQFPRGLETLEIVHPHQTYPYKAGLVLSDNLLAHPLSHFRNLSELDLQHIGGPICEVFFNLVEIGKQLKVLKLHDQTVEGIEKRYWIQRSQPHPHSEYLECPFWKLLVYTCPDVEILSLDISNIALERDDIKECKRASDWRSIALEPILEEMEHAPTLEVFETLRSLRCLRSLRLMTLDTYDTIRTRTEPNWIPVSKKLWSANLESFILSVTFFTPQTRDISSVKDVVRIDRQSASSLDTRKHVWRAIPGFHLDANSM
ncbi:MAG: hypothetical protein Q9174_003761 [Haloplaca sp. 1 TL-2023]